MDSEFWTAVAAIGAALSAIFAAVTAHIARRQIASAERSTEAAVILEITRAWNNIYSDYRNLKANPVDVAAAIKGKPNFDAYATTEDWKRMRPIFAFYEFLGSAIRSGFIKEPTLFALVTVDTGLWDTYEALIRHFRSERPDLYTSWEHLVSRRKQYEPGKEHVPLPARRLFGKWWTGGR